MVHKVRGFQPVALKRAVSKFRIFGSEKVSY